jgi:lipoprotein-anchoring transpeptidase ErfK/SrfK
VWLPYWQRFVGGIGFHETTSYLHDPALGSHGCVNLLHRDAVTLWGELHMGATVRVFGRRPGT